MELKIGDIVEHKVHVAAKWGFGIIKEHYHRHGVYKVIWSDGAVRTHTFELLKRIA